jgi:hypothetical protein
MRFVRTAALLASALVLGAGSVQAAPAGDFYKGRTVYVIIGYSAGGGYDLYARVLSQHLGKHIPGNPTVIPQNMPGAGSVKAAAYVFTAAPKDGTVIGTFARGMAATALIGQAPFDARKFTWLGSATKDVTLCVSWSASPTKTWNDVLVKAGHFRRPKVPRAIRIFSPSSTRTSSCEDQVGDRISGHDRHHACHAAARGRWPVRHFLEHRSKRATALGEGEETQHSPASRTGKSARSSQRPDGA